MTSTAYLDHYNKISAVDFPYEEQGSIHDAQVELSMRRNWLWSAFIAAYSNENKIKIY